MKNISKKLCEGFVRIEESKSFRNYELNLFGLNRDFLTMLELIDKEMTSPEWKECKPQIRINLDRDTINSEECVAAYIGLARKYPDAMFFLETVEPKRLQHVYPIGESFPENVMIGTRISNNAESLDRLESLFEVKCAYRYAVVENPTAYHAVEDIIADYDTTPLHWMVVMIDSESENAEQSMECVAHYRSLSEEWNIPLHVEGLEEDYPIPHHQRDPELFYLHTSGLNVDWGIIIKETWETRHLTDLCVRCSHAARM